MSTNVQDARPKRLIKPRPEIYKMNVTDWLWRMRQKLASAQAQIKDQRLRILTLENEITTLKESELLLRCFKAQAERDILLGRLIRIKKDQNG